MTALTRIEVEAFKAFAEKASLDLSALPPGLHYVRGCNLTNDRLGSNGAGKTSFFSDAPTWVLYGKTVGGLRTTDVRSWLTEKKPPRGAVTLRDGEHERVAQRGPRATDLTIDGKQVGQDAVDALIGIGYEVWCQAIVMGQGAPLFFDKSPSEKMALLSDAMGLERWERRAQAAAARARRLEDRLRGVEGEVLGLETARDHAQDALGRARSASEEWGRGQAARIEENARTASLARSRAAQIEGRRGEAALAADSAGLLARELRPDAQAARDALARAREEARGAEREIAAAERELTRAEEALASFARQGVCPTCGQAVAKKDAAQHAGEIKNQVADLHHRLKKLRALRGDYVGQAIEREAWLTKYEPKLTEAEKVERRAEGELHLLERELASAQAQAAAAEEAHRRIKAEENPHRQAAQDARKRLREVEATLKEKSDLVGKLAASVERAQFWARGFRDIRLQIIDELIDDLRGTTAEVLDGLGLGEWEVEYATERETKSGAVRQELAVSIRSTTAPEGVRWENYSGGERQRLRLAGALALSEVLLAHAGASIDFRVLDEPTRGLSREGVRDLVEVLGDYARRAGLKIFYIDHQAEDGARFASTITVTNDASRGRLDSCPN